MTPVLLLSFNRPHLTEQVARCIAEMSDGPVYLSFDGARSGRPGEHHLVRETEAAAQDILQGRVTAVRKSASNLGCARSVYEGLSWFFDQVEEGVVLEDDCIPTETFFDFADYGLHHFRNRHDIGAICGSNFAPHDIDAAAMVAESHFFHLWGWATWRRALDGYQLQYRDWRKQLRKTAAYRSLTPLERRDWRRNFAVADVREPHTWDYQFVLHQWVSGRKAALPRVPLVENAGFDSGTHFGGGPPDYYRSPSIDEVQGYIEDLRGGRGWISASTPRMDRWIARNVYSPSAFQRVKRRLAMPRNG